MPGFAAPDGTELAYYQLGDGRPVVCIPGGPMEDSAYLGNLGGLTAHHQLIMLDPRGTGASAIPDDRDSYRCDRLVNDVDALREHLGLDRMELLAHSAGTNVAVRYVERHPDRVSKLALITPSPMAVGIPITTEMRLEAARLRREEPWFPDAFAALEAIVTGRATDTSWEAIAPFVYGRWDAVAQAHRAAEAGHRNDDAAAVFGAAGAFDPAATRRAIASFAHPVLLLAGEVDLNTPTAAVVEYARLFRDSELVVQPGAGHFPWLDDADLFVATTATFFR